MKITNPKTFCSVFTFGLTFLIFQPSFAANPYLEITESEREQQRQKATVIAETAADCLSEFWEDHNRFFDANGFSKYYGDRQEIYATSAKRKAAIKALDKETELESQMVGISCVGLTKICLGRGFYKAGLKATWDKINNYLAKTGSIGIHLQHILVDLGWKTYYWNPEPSQNKAWDAEDRRINPLTSEDIAKNRKNKSVWGNHSAHFATATKSIAPHYWKVPIADSRLLVGFGSNEPQEFKRFPFFVGTAHASYHVFPGSFGQVIEAHSKRLISSRDNLEIGDFNPLAPGGSPKWTRTERYRSGIIVVPPGY